ncbi:MAG TPA: FAD-dependent oxidoreductase [Clostridia bacterium]|nr:FAD-dependent oxidoreductase [Clostridia bacterium]
MRYVIVGASAAGIAAAEAIRENDASGEMTMISEEDSYPYARIFLPLHATGRLDLERFYIRPPGWYDENGVDLILGDRASSLDLPNRRAILKSGRTLPFDRLLLATGARPARLGVPGEGLYGVTGLRTVRDSEVVRRRISWAREMGRVPHALIVGGGLVSMKACEALVDAGVECTMVVASRRVLSRMLDEEVSSLVEERMKERGVRVVLGVEVSYFGGDDGSAERRSNDAHPESPESGEPPDGLTYAVLSTGERIACDIAIVGKGVTPDAILFYGLDGIAPPEGPSPDVGIPVDERQRTVHPDVYAAGDVASAKNRQTAKREIIATWLVAREQGRIAGLNMAGVDAVYEGGIRANAASFFGIATASVGDVAARGSRQREYVVSDRPGSYRKMVLDLGPVRSDGESVIQGKITEKTPTDVTGTPTGVVMAGRIGGAGVLRRLLAEGRGGEEVLRAISVDAVGYPVAVWNRLYI